MINYNRQAMQFFGTFGLRSVFGILRSPKIFGRKQKLQKIIPKKIFGSKKKRIIKRDSIQWRDQVCTISPSQSRNDCIKNKLMTVKTQFSPLFDEASNTYKREIVPPSFRDYVVAEFKERSRQFPYLVGDNTVGCVEVAHSSTLPLHKGDPWQGRCFIFSVCDNWTKEMREVHMCTRKF